VTLKLSLIFRSGELKEINLHPCEEREATQISTFSITYLTAAASLRTWAAGGILPFAALVVMLGSHCYPKLGKKYVSISPA
jgi:hypothetical protein